MGVTASPADMAQRVRDVLDPLLTEHCFAPGQAGHGDESFQMLYCAAYDEFAARYPGIRIEGFQVGVANCVDLHVNGATGRGLIGVDLEGTPLTELLRRAGLVDRAASLGSATDGPFEDDLARIAESLDALFATHHDH